MIALQPLTHQSTMTLVTYKRKLTSSLSKSLVLTPTSTLSVIAAAVRLHMPTWGSCSKVLTVSRFHQMHISKPLLHLTLLLGVFPSSQPTAHFFKAMSPSNA